MIHQNKIIDGDSLDRGNSKAHDCSDARNSLPSVSPALWSGLKRTYEVDSRSQCSGNSKFEFSLSDNTVSLPTSSVGVNNGSVENLETENLEEFLTSIGIE